ncbi:alpha/beta hydrolase [Enterococcus faecalis]|uniref:alpha/beta hydrolase n=1 Tax=Enterococcus faecalis TaxID=1351 RepID=UPI00076FBD08|nr:alpha/beta hydrolase [Enterococcus faecalis]
MKKKILKFILWLFGILIVMMLAVFAAFQLSPRPGTYVIGLMFDSPVSISDKQAYKKAKDNVKVISNEVYKSKHKESTFDIYYPKNASKAVPVMIWAHGGGFVAGDKSGLKEFATRIVSDANIAVVAMNYETAPDSQYPNQVKQVNDLVKELQTRKMAELDLSKLFLGGDSAGAQIALQYAAVQTNASYADEMGMMQTIPEGNLKGTISYCGPVVLKQTAQQHSDNRFMKFFVKTVAWSLIGTKDWKNDPKLFQASLVDHVSNEFPPTYITDGNAYSFQEQGITLENRLNKLGVPVQGLFYTNDKKEITHEYQFDYSTTEAKECYQQTLKFLNQYK